jgi:hypothetical protein
MPRMLRSCIEATAIVADLEDQIAAARPCNPDADGYRLRIGVFDDVVESFLHDPKQLRLDVLGEDKLRVGGVDLYP